MGAYRCRSCDYIYDPEEKQHLGVPFETVPEDWVCPACHAKKDNFVKLGEEYRNHKKEFIRKRSESALRNDDEY